MLEGVARLLALARLAPGVLLAGQDDEGFAEPHSPEHLLVEISGGRNMNYVDPS